MLDLELRAVFEAETGGAKNKLLEFTSCTVLSKMKEGLLLFEFDLYTHIPSCFTVDLAALGLLSSVFHTPVIKYLEMPKD